MQSDRRAACLIDSLRLSQTWFDEKGRNACAKVEEKEGMFAMTLGYRCGG